MTFLAELRAHHLTHGASLRRRRAYPDLLHVEVAQDIALDAAREQGRAGRHAYTAEQADLEAARLLRATLSDGRITPAELPALRHALRHVTRAAAHDNRITEILA